MFTAYHAIMFAVLLIGGAGVVFQASSGEEVSVSFLNVPYTRFKLYMLSISNICRPFDL